MIFNPVSKELFTDEWEYMKTLHCPKRAEWERMSTLSGVENVRICEHCDHPVLDTEGISDQELLRLLHKEPQTCLKIGLDQSNVRIAPIRREV